MQQPQPFDPADLLPALRFARWETAFRTVGNSHATLIGLLVDWWVHMHPVGAWAVEGGPTYESHPKHIGSETCDALLCEGRTPVGVVEVEGWRYQTTIEKLGKFLTSGVEDLQALRFGILLAYHGTAPEGRGEARGIRTLPADEFIDVASNVTLTCPGKYIAVLTLDKTWKRGLPGIRGRNEFYGASVSRVCGALIQNGSVSQRDFVIAIDQSTA